MNNSSNKTLLLPLIIAAMLFFVIGFGVGIGGFLGDFLQNHFNLSETQKYFVIAATFSAFVIFGMPAGMIIKKVGYKNAMIIALILMAIGWLVYLPSAKMDSFPLFLGALFVGGIGNTILQASVNPYVTIAGPKESAAWRMCLMGITNKSAWWLGSLFLGMFLSVKDAKMEDVPVPAIITASLLIVFAIALYFIKLPDVQPEESAEPVSAENALGAATAGKTSVWQYPHLILGAIALFIYVGVETLPLASMVGYVKAAFGAGVAKPEEYIVYVTIGLVAGYVFGVVAIPKIISQNKAMILFTSLALLTSLILIFLPVSSAKTGIYCIAALGTFHSVMWGVIWALAIDGLGKLTNAGSSVLVMGIVGGALIPLLFGFILDTVKTTPIATIANYQTAYWLLVPCYAYMLYYVLAGHKVGRKNV